MIKIKGDQYLGEIIHLDVITVISSFRGYNLIYYHTLIHLYIRNYAATNSVSS